MKICFQLKDFIPKDCTPKFNMTDIDPSGNQIHINRTYFEYNQKPLLLIMGEFHYSRYPTEFWEDSNLKMKANGINIITTYVFWIHHEEIQGKFNWEGNNDLHKFIALCKKH